MPQNNDDISEKNYKKFMEEVENTPTTVRPSDLSQLNTLSISTESSEKFDTTYKEKYIELIKQLKITNPELIDTIFSELQNSQVLPENLEQTVKELLDEYAKKNQNTPSTLTVESIDASATEDLENQKNSIVPQVPTPIPTKPVNGRVEPTNDEKEQEF